MFVAPDPGALRGYLAALERLRALDLALLCPGHGPPVNDPAAMLDRYLAHRLDRERRLVAALADGLRTVDELLDRVWDDAPASLRLAATATLAAHLDKLDEEGRLPDGRRAPAVAAAGRVAAGELRSRESRISATATRPDARRRPPSASRSRARPSRPSSGEAPVAFASSKMRRSVSPMPRTRLRRAARVVALGLELDGDVDDPARVDDEVRRPQDAVLRQQLGDVVVRELVVRRARDDRRAEPRGGVVVEHRRPARTARRRRPCSRAPRRARSSARPGRRRSRACERSMSVTSSVAPASAQSFATRAPTWPSPAITIVRSPSDGEPKTRSQHTPIAAWTPSAVHGLGSPDPPRRRDSPVTWRVAEAMTSMSRADVPTSSAVMYAPSSASTASPKSRSASARRPRRAGESGSGARMMPLPPPSGRPATADLNVIARDRRRTSRIAARASS